LVAKKNGLNEGDPIAGKYAKKEKGVLLGGKTLKRVRSIADGTKKKKREKNKGRRMTGEGI